MMKALLYIFLAAIILFIVSQIWAKSQTNNIEMYPYEVLEEFREFEIRKYAPANFAYVTMEAQGYDKSSSEGFGQLAGYIFGANESNEKIAMTSPVEMEMKDEITMKFLVPAAYKLEEMPTPENANVRFKKEPSKIVAAIRFGGFADDEKINKYKEKLFTYLEQKEIVHDDTYSFMGYNPPFDLFNRRNEIIVEIYEFDKD